MTDAVAASPPRSFVPLAQKAIAVLALLLAAFLVWYIDRLPSAIELDSSKPLQARADDELRLFGFPEGQVLEYHGQAGQNLDVRADASTLSPETRANLVDGGAEIADGPLKLSWLGRPDPGGKVGLTISSAGPRRASAVTLAATGADNIPQLSITPLGGTLTVTLGTVAGDSDHQPRTDLTLGDAPMPALVAAATSLQFELPAGTPLVLTFPTSDAMKAAFLFVGVRRNGNELGTSLALDRIAIGPQASPNGVRDGACAAPAGKLLLTRLRPRDGQCGAAEKLHLHKLSLAPDGIAATITGNGFVITNGKVQPAGLMATLKNNLVIGAVLTLAFGLLAKWVWSKLFGTTKV